MTTEDQELKDQELKDQELKKKLEKFDWNSFLQYGSVKVQIRHGKMTVITVARTYQAEG